MGLKLAADPCWPRSARRQNIGWRSLSVDDPLPDHLPNRDTKKYDRNNKSLIFPGAQKDPGHGQSRKTRTSAVEREIDGRGPGLGPSSEKSVGRTGAAQNVTRFPDTRLSTLIYNMKHFRIRLPKDRWFSAVDPRNSLDECGFTPLEAALPQSGNGKRQSANAPLVDRW